MHLGFTARCLTLQKCPRELWMGWLGNREQCQGSLSDWSVLGHWVCLGHRGSSGIWAALVPMSLFTSGQVQPTKLSPTAGLSPQNRVFCSSRWASAFLCSSGPFPIYLFSSSPKYYPPPGRQALLVVLGSFSSSCTLLTGTFSAFLISPRILLLLSYLPLNLFALPRQNLPCLDSNKERCSSSPFGPA